MRFTRWTGLTTAAFVAATVLISAGPASAFNVSVEFVDPSLMAGTQTLVVTMADTAGVTVYATYRRVDSVNPPALSAACELDFAANTDTVLIGPELSTGTVTRSKSLPLGKYAVCLYQHRPGYAIERIAGFLDGWVATGPVPVVRRATTISLGVARTGIRVTASGRATGRATGTVAVQRRTATGGYVTIANLPVRAYVYRAVVPASAGQTIRVVLLASPGYAASRSGDIRIR